MAGKQLPEKVINVNGNNVHVATEKHPTNPQFKVSATIGPVTYEEYITFGPVDSHGANGYTQEQMQKDLDTHRAKCAKIAEFRHRVYALADAVH